MPLGSWVINEACRQARAWALDVASGDGGVRIWVNVSARQLDEPALVATVREALTSAQLPADRLCIEITESALMRDAEAAAAQLEEVRRLGISLGKRTESRLVAGQISFVDETGYQQISLLPIVVELLWVQHWCGLVGPRLGRFHEGLIIN